MKIRNILLALSLIMSLSLFAKNITLDQAQKVASNFYYEKFNQYQGALDFKNIGTPSVIIDKEGSLANYYVFHFNSGGFVIISAEDCLNPILGYSFDSKYETENQPDNVQFWFEHYREQIAFVRSNSLTATADVKQSWDYYLNAEPSELNIEKQSRGDGYLMTTKWNQSWPYNLLCPIGEGGQAVSGCVATGYAQCLYYWRFPEHGTGTYCYTHDVYGQLCADFGSTFYRWDEMTDVPRINDTAVGELVYHLGVALDMNYSPTGSGTWMYPEQIEEHFNVSPDLEWISKEDYSSAQWLSIVKEQIDLKYVIPYVGYSNSGGHFWVCDGYQDDDYFHMNWGWGGQSDGFFTLSSPEGYGYGQSIGINFYPDAENWDYPYYESGEHTYTYLEGSISDGSGPINDYLNNTQASWLIDPQTQNDSISSITINIKRFGVSTDGDYLKIFSGGDNSAPLLVELSGDEIPDEIVSPSSKVFIEFYSNGENTAEGFYLNYECETALFCTEVSQISDVSAVISDGSGDFYYSNNSFCLWMIDPGTEEPLSLNFNYFETEADKDVLKIYDGGTQQLLAEYSGSYENAPQTVVSPSGKMIIKFVSNSDVQMGGWEAWYDVSTGISEKANIDFTIMPNPVTSQMRIQFYLPENEDVKIDITDMLGHQLRQVSHEKLDAGKQNISVDLNDFIKGIYLLRIQIGDNISVKKIMKY